MTPSIKAHRTFPACSSQACRGGCKGCPTPDACLLPESEAEDMRDLWGAILAAVCFVSVCAVLGNWLGTNWTTLVAFAARLAGV